MKDSKKISTPEKIYFCFAIIYLIFVLIRFFFSKETFGPHEKLSIIILSISLIIYIIAYSKKRLNK